MKKLIVLFVVLSGALNCIAQNNYSEPVLSQIEIYAVNFNASYSPEKTKEDVMNNGVYIKIPKSEILEESKILEYLGDLEEVKWVEECEQVGIRAVVLLSYPNQIRRNIYCITRSREGILDERVLHKPHPQLYKTIYSFLPKCFFDESYFSKKEYKKYDLKK